MKRTVVCYQLRRNFAKLSTKCPSCHQSESEEVWTNTTIYSDALHDCHWRSKVDKDCSSLPASSSQWSSNQRFSVLHFLKWGCYLEVQSVIHAPTAHGPWVLQPRWSTDDDGSNYSVETLAKFCCELSQIVIHINFCAVLHHLWGMQIHLKIVIMRPFSFLLLGAAALNNPWSETPAWEKEKRA